MEQKLGWNMVQISSNERQASHHTIERITVLEAFFKNVILFNECTLRVYSRKRRNSKVCSRHPASNFFSFSEHHSLRSFRVTNAPIVLVFSVGGCNQGNYCTCCFPAVSIKPSASFPNCFVH